MGLLSLSLPSSCAPFPPPYSSPPSIPTVPWHFKPALASFGLVEAPSHQLGGWLFSPCLLLCICPLCHLYSSGGRVLKLGQPGSDSLCECHVYPADSLCDLFL